MLEADIWLDRTRPVRGKRQVREMRRGRPLTCAVWSSTPAGVYVGSLKLDPRSHQHKTDMGLLIRSPEPVRNVINIVDRLNARSPCRQGLADDHAQERVATGVDGVERVRESPESGFWSRPLLKLPGALHSGGPAAATSGSTK